jgi:hypothetical protein
VTVSASQRRNQYANLSFSGGAPIMPEMPSFDNTMPAGHNCRNAGEKLHRDKRTGYDQL